MINDEIEKTVQRAKDDLSKQKWCSDNVEQLIQKLNSTHTGSLLTEYMSKVYQQNQKRNSHQNTVRVETEKIKAELKAKGITGDQLTAETNEATKKLWDEWEKQNLVVTPID